MNGLTEHYPDPLREPRIVKRFVQVGVYSAVTATQASFYYVLGYSALQAIVGFVVGTSIATIAIEALFWQILKLRKQSGYPGIIAVRLGTVQDLGEAYSTSLDMVHHYMNATAGFIAWVEDGHLLPVCSRGMPEDWIKAVESSHHCRETLSGVLRRQRPSVMQVADCPLAAGMAGVDRAALIPLAARDRVSGVMFLAGPRGADLRDRKLLEAVGMVVGLALENMRLTNREYESIMQVLCSALDMRDSATEGHSQRVSRMTGMVSQQMGLASADIRLIERAAALHDIGKIGVADAVLSKPGPLSDEEWVEMRRHPRLGYEIVEGIEALRNAADIVHAHHERYDGAGYPRGIAAGEIPIGARIFAVVDAYDAMTSHRPYRRARSHREAVEEIVRNSGTQFDPGVVQAFLEVERVGLIAPHDLPDEDAPPSQRPRNGADGVASLPDAVLNLSSMLGIDE
ncbi:MAG: HD domain-containing phosphohydrolase [Dehalococcoidia bacterium]